MWSIKETIKIIYFIHKWKKSCQSYTNIIILSLWGCKLIYFQFSPLVLLLLIEALPCDYQELIYLTAFFNKQLCSQNCIFYSGKLQAKYQYVHYSHTDQKKYNPKEAFSKTIQMKSLNSSTTEFKYYFISL